MASLENTKENSENLEGRVCFGFGFSAAVVSSMAVVILAIFSSRGDFYRGNESHNG